MSDLVEFLRARLAEDEAGARAATAGPWYWDGDYPSTAPCPHGTEWCDHGPDLRSRGVQTESGNDEYVTNATGYDASWMVIPDADAKHIARRDPARVLAEVAAKREMVAHSEIVHERAKVGPAPGDGAWFLMLRYLALPYAAHPDYDKEWRP